MFFKRRREAHKAQVAEKDHKQLAALQDALAQAEAMTDIGEKLIALDDLSTTANEQAHELMLSRELGTGATLSFGASLVSFFGAGGGAGFGTLLGITKLATLASIALPGALVIIPLGVGIVSGLGAARVAGKHTGKQSDKMFNATHKELVDGMAALLPQIKAAQDETLGHSLQEFAASKKFDTLYDRFPTLKDRFVKEAFRKETVASLPPAADNPAAASPKKNSFNP